MLNLFGCGNFCSRFINALCEGEVFSEENSVGLFQGGLRFFTNIVPFQAFFIQGTGDGGIAVGQHIRRDVLDDFAAAADDGHGADAAKLMHGGNASDDGAVFHGDVASKGSDVGHHNVIAELAIVRDVGVGEEVIVRTNYSSITVVGGAVDGDVFAKGVVVADAGVGGATGMFEVLRLEANAGEGVDCVGFAQLGVAGDDDVGMKSATLAKCDIRANDTVGTNVATFGDPGTLFDDGGGVYLAHYDDELTTRRYR